MTTLHSSQTLNSSGHLFNGVLSGLSAVTVLQPGYTLQTYLSTGKGLPPLNTLYRGFAANATCDVSGSALTFLFYGVLSRSMAKGGESHSKEKEAGIGLVAGAGASPAMAACERVMILQQIHGGSIAQTVRKIIAHEGNLGLIKGTVPTIAREALCGAALFGISDMLAGQIKQVFPSDNASKIAGSFVTGSFVGAITTPCNNIKTVLQEEIGASSALKIGKQLMNQKRLFAGVVPRSILIGSLMVILGQVKETMPSYYPDSLHE